MPSVTVIGDSMARGLAPQIGWGKEFDATGFVYGGQTARQINSNVRSIQKTDVTVISSGTNNALSQTTIQSIEEVRQLIDNMGRKRQGDHVIMCEIPYIPKKPDLNSKIDEINDFIKSETIKRTNFHLLTCDLDELDYRRDKLHLNDRGTAKRALEIRRIIRKCNIK